MKKIIIILLLLMAVSTAKSQSLQLPPFTWYLGQAQTWTQPQTFYDILPSGNKTYNFGSADAYWLYGYVRHLRADTATIGYLTFTASDTTYANVIPATDSAYDVGSADLPFRRGYFSSNVYSAYLWASNYIQTTAIYNTHAGSKTSIKFVGTTQDSIQFLTNDIARITIDTVGGVNIHKQLNLGGNYTYLVGSAGVAGSWRFKATLSGNIIFEYTANGTDWTTRSTITNAD